MIDKNNAIERIEEIYSAIQKSFLVALPGRLLIAIGIAISMIPFVEFFLSAYVDPLLTSLGASRTIIFLGRTVFYWGSFALISISCSKKTSMHPAIKRAWGLNDFFPLIPITTAAMLAITGNTKLIMPIVLILIGCFWTLIGRFTSQVITCFAIANIVVGIAGIYLTTLTIPYFWQLLLTFQGISCFVAGLIIQAQQRSQNS